MCMSDNRIRHVTRNFKDWVKSNELYHYCRTRARKGECYDTNGIGLPER